jgi:ATP-dependent HslUV protease subunit HslV
MSRHIREPETIGRLASGVQGERTKKGDVRPTPLFTGTCPNARRTAGNPRMVATTVLGLRLKGRAALGGDGQVTLEGTILKNKARKGRKLADGRILAGFAGAAADALTLFDHFEGKLKEFSGSLPRAAVELAKEWRTDRALRRLDALLAVVSRDHALVISGTGDVIEPDDGIVAIGAGGAYAMAAARALIGHSSLSAREIVLESLKIAASLCIYTNDQLWVEEL